MTTRGLGGNEMKLLAGWMYRVAEICASAGCMEGLEQFNDDLAAIRAEVRNLALEYPLP